MIKTGFLFMLGFIFLVVLSLIPLGCDDTDTGGTDSKAAISSKTGYVYAPVKPETGKSGLFLGLIALEQNIPPEGYQIVSDARIIIGDKRVKTDDKGNFKITNVNPGEHEMLVCAKGFQPVVQITAISAASSSTVAISTLKVVPEKAIVIKGNMMPFTAVGKDPGGNFVPLSSVSWNIINTDKEEKKELGKVSNTGLLKANEVGTVKVVAASSTYTANTEITILDPANTNTSTLTGKVALASGSPMEGAQVIIMGTTLMSDTDKDGKYSLLDVPSDVPLTLFVIKNDTIIGNAPVQLEKWKEKSLDILATSNPPAIAEDANSVVPEKTPSGKTSTTGTINGYVFIPSNNDKKGENLSKLIVLQSKASPKGYMAIAGAKVMLESDPTISSITSSDGAFTLNGVSYKGSGGPHFVVVTADGFASMRSPVLFTGTYPLGTVSKMEVYPVNPVIPVGGIIEFKVLCYDRKDQIIETPKMSWSYEGDRGEIEPIEGVFTAEKIGNGSVTVTYGDIHTKKEFKIIDKEETGSMAGLVSDENKKPVKGAFVIVENCPWVGITDENGKYTIPYIPTGEKMPLFVKVYGKKCGEEVASIGKNMTITRDVSIVLPKEEVSEPNKPVVSNPSIPDMPPTSIKPDSNSLPANTVSKQSKTPSPTPGESKGEFPRWPGTNDNSQKQNNKSQDSYPRWPNSSN